jgi:lipopolysaccharide/colanic/teichoic acid biosynthesis glycosyltransferase
LLLEVRPISAYVRRGVDLLVLAAAAPFVVPAVVLLALIVKLDSPGPAFVRIERVGRDGRPFGLLKLRSMRRDAEQLKQALRHLNTLPWPDFKIADDPRVTRAGRWLRRHSLDELPQLYNVLRGDMTLIGPRPCSVKLAHYELWQTERLEVTPGLVGRWQAEGRGTLDFASRARLDIAQSRSRSLRGDIAMVAATLRSVLGSRGAY